MTSMPRVPLRLLSTSRTRFPSAPDKPSTTSIPLCSTTTRAYRPALNCSKYTCCSPPRSSRTAGCPTTTLVVACSCDWRGVVAAIMFEHSRRQATTAHRRTHAEPEDLEEWAISDIQDPEILLL